MEQKNRGPGCLTQAPFLALIAVVLLACVGLPTLYAALDYTYVQGTLRGLQDAVLFGVWTVVWGLVGLAVVLGAYAGLGLVGGFTRWASPRARESAERIAIARAQHMELPDGLSAYNVVHNHNQRLPAPVIAESQGTVIEGSLAPPALPVGPLPHEDASFETGRSRIAQLVDRRHIYPTGDKILVGYAGETPLHLRAADWGLAIIAGQSGKGKSSLAGLIIAQAAIAGWAIIVCDPVYHREERSLLKDFLTGLSGAIWKQAVQADEIAAAVGTAMGIANKRLTEGVSGARVLLVIDEFSTVAGRKMLDADAMEDLFLTATKASAVGVHTLLIAHDLSGSWFGGQAARRGRDQATHRLVCNMAPTAAAAILPNQAYAQQVAILPVGQALYFDGWDQPALAAFPRLSPADLAWAAGGKAPTPYTPRVAPPALTPTEPIAAAAAVTPLPPLRAVPPTVELSTAQQIVAVLRGAGRELTTEEVIALVGPGVAEGTIRNTLGKLRGDQLIATRRVGRSFVYSVSETALTI